MTDLVGICLFTVALLALTANAMLGILLRRRPASAITLLQPHFDAVNKGLEGIERSVRDDIGRFRQESTTNAALNRDEIGGSLRASADALGRAQSEVAGQLNTRLDKLTESHEDRSELLRLTVEKKLGAVGEDLHCSAKANGEMLVLALKDIGALQLEHIKQFSERLDVLINTTERRLTELRETTDLRSAAVQEDHGRRLDLAREESATTAKLHREELSGALKSFNDSVIKSMVEMATAQKGEFESFTSQLGRLTESNRERMEELRVAVDGRLKLIQDDNSKQLEQMRLTVDEKLQGTLEKRLGESFQQVAERLEQVHKGLGEMQTLATGVGDLKRVLTNVKARGGWGEVQLGALLEEMLSSDQFERNVATRDGSLATVEFAVKLPGRDESGEAVYLPIDAKFPTEDFQRLVLAQEQADAIGMEEAGKALESRIKDCAKDISTKYLNPPKTTDFGIMFLPTEGLYAEVIRRPGLAQLLQREHRVMVAGPTTLAALLNTLQMGFRTLAVQQRSSEVWKLLGAVKTEFGKFGDVLENVKKKLDQASNTMDETARRSRAIERSLRSVEALPAAEAYPLLRLVEQVEVQVE